MANGPQGISFGVRKVDSAAAQLFAGLLNVTWRMADPASRSTPRQAGPTLRLSSSSNTTRPWRTGFVHKLLPVDHLEPPERDGGAD